MRRREFITLLGWAMVMSLRAARAQQSGIQVIGHLTTGSPDDWNPDNTAAFARGLAEMGYVVGNNVTIERRWARGKYDRLPELAQELVRLKPALIVAAGNVVALAVRRATSTIPIVFNIASDPVKLGLAKSFAHPGGNATGVSVMTATLTLKRLELIQELIPQNSAVGFLITRTIKTCCGKSKTLHVRPGGLWRSRWHATLMTSNQHLHSLSVLKSALYSSPTMRFF
jgi:putative ABC transport system substrate-binding protein